MIWWDGKFSILWCQKHIILHEIASRKVGLIKDYGCDNMDILQSRVVAWASRGAGGEFIKSMLQRKKHNLVLPWPHSLSSACPHNFLGLFTSPLQCRHSLVPIKGHVPNKQLEDIECVIVLRIKKLNREHCSISSPFKKLKTLLYFRIFLFLKNNSRVF